MPERYAADDDASKHHERSDERDEARDDDERRIGYFQSGERDEECRDDRYEEGAGDAADIFGAVYQRADAANIVAICKKPNKKKITKPPMSAGEMPVNEKPSEPPCEFI